MNHLLQYCSLITSSSLPLLSQIPPVPSRRTLSVWIWSLPDQQEHRPSKTMDHSHTSVRHIRTPTISQVRCDKCVRLIWEGQVVWWHWKVIVWETALVVCRLLHMFWMAQSCPSVLEPCSCVPIPLSGLETLNKNMEKLGCMQTHSLTLLFSSLEKGPNSCPVWADESGSNVLTCVSPPSLNHLAPNTYICNPFPVAVSFSSQRWECGMKEFESLQCIY